MALTTFQSMLAQAKRSEPRALTDLHTQYLPVIRNHISGRVPPDEVEHITSEVFFKILDDIHDLLTDDEGAFRAWVIEITRKTVARYYRVRSRVQIFPLDTTPEAEYVVSPDDPTQRIETIERITALSDAMNRVLSTDELQIIHGRFIQEKPVRALAQQLGKREPAIHLGQHRALGKLRKDPALKRLWSARLIMYFLVSVAAVSLCVCYIGRTQPGDPGYSIKQIFTGDPSSAPVPRYRPVAVPTIAPTPTAQPSPTPTPSPTATSKVLSPTPTTDPNGGILGTVATALPVTSDNGTPVTCVLSACVTLP